MERRLRIGWGWWVAAGLALLALWGLALRGSVLYAVERGETALGRKLERLSHDLRELRPTGARREEAGTTALSPLVRDRLAEFEMDTGATWSLLPLRQAQRWLAANEIAVDGRPARGGWVAATRPRAGTWEHMLMAGPPRHPGPPGEGPPAFAGPAPPPGMPPPPPGMLPPPGFGHGEAPTGSGRGPGRPDFGPVGRLHLLVNVPVWPVAAPTVWAFLFILGGIGALAGGLAGALRVSLRALTREVELAKAKANFTAMVSHELRTPIAVLRMHAEALRDDLVVDRGKRHEFLDSMAQEALRLQRLIENLLDLGRVERGAKLYRLVPSDLAAIAHQAVAQARQAFGDAAPEIEIEAAAGLPRALADPDAAQQAIANLVHNALKYGGDPPEVGVGISHGHGRVRVAVLDRGPGIPPEQRESVFDPYVRVGQEITRTSQGLGLGLALVRAYMRGQGGTVVLKDRPGGGSVFELDFAEEK